MSSECTDRMRQPLSRRAAFRLMVVAAAGLSLGRGALAEEAAGAEGEGAAAPDGPDVDPNADAPQPAINDQANVDASIEDFLTSDELSYLANSPAVVDDGVSAAAYTGVVQFADLLGYAARYLGVPYVFGGKDPNVSGGFDCSGFVCWVFDHVAGTNLASGWCSAEGLYYESVYEVAPADARPGDLVFFRGTYGGPDHVSHVGIYLGNDIMIQASNSGVSYANINWFVMEDGYTTCPRMFGRLSMVDVQHATFYLFYDVPSDAWYVQGGYLDYVVNAGIMTGGTTASGESNGLFMPEDGVTRGQVATILYRCASASIGGAGGASSFADVPAWEYYAEPIAWCHGMGIVTGYKDASDNPTGYFGPEDPVSRSDLATMVARLASCYGYDVNSADAGALDGMPDAGEIPDYALGAMAWCAGVGVVTGDMRDGTPHARPYETATRFQMAKVMTVLMQSVL